MPRMIRGMDTALEATGTPAPPTHEETRQRQREEAVQREWQRWAAETDAHLNTFFLPPRQHYVSRCAPGEPWVRGLLCRLGPRTLGRLKWLSGRSADAHPAGSVELWLLAAERNSYAEGNLLGDYCDPSRTVTEAFALAVDAVAAQEWDADHGEFVLTPSDVPLDAEAASRRGTAGPPAPEAPSLSPAQQENLATLRDAVDELERMGRDPRYGGHADFQHSGNYLVQRRAQMERIADLRSHGHLLGTPDGVLKEAVGEGLWTALPARPHVPPRPPSLSRAGASVGAPVIVK